LRLFDETSHERESHKQRDDYDGEFHVTIKKQIIECMNITLNESWLNGKYSCGVINTSLVTVEVFDLEEGFFAQGEHAWEIISEIHQIWVNGDLTTEHAFQQWISINF